MTWPSKVCDMQCCGSAIPHLRGTRHHDHFEVNKNQQKNQCDCLVGGVELQYTNTHLQVAFDCGCVAWQGEDPV